MQTRIVVHRPGGGDALRFERFSEKPPGPGEVLVRVKACGVNFADLFVRRGVYAAAKGLYPICPGLEFSGDVSETGPGVEAFNAGDRVFGACRFGGYSSAVTCRADHLWHLPRRWSYHRGASFPVAYLTACYGLHPVGHLGPEDVVLVHSAAGGVGTAALHLLGINGGRAVGVVGSAHKKSHAEAAGATDVVVASSRGFWMDVDKISPDGFDLILDSNGASTLKGSYSRLRPGGRLLIYGFASMFPRSGRTNRVKLLWDYLRTPRFSPFHLTGSNRTVSGFNLIYLFDRVSLFRRIMERLLEWDSAGLLPPMPVTLFPFADAAGAHRAIESGLSVGKLVLSLDE